MLLKEVHFYDSNSGDGAKYLKNGLRWLADESMDKKKTALNTREWRLFHQEVHVPQQHNGFDCGVFVLMCARAIAYNQPFSSYHQSGMPQYRSMVGRHILRGSLLDSNKQSVPYTYNLTPDDHHQTAQLYQVSAELSSSAERNYSNNQSTKAYSSSSSSFKIHTSFSCSSSSKTTSAAATTAPTTGYDSLDSEEDDEEDQQHNTKRNQLLTNVNTEDSEEDNESPNYFSVLFANARKFPADVKHNTSKSQVPSSSSSCHYYTSSTIGKKSSAAGAEEDSVDSEEDEDQLLPHQGKSNLLIIRGKTAEVHNTSKSQVPS
jgi:hypothetical protein